jgi:hypothetical protein
VGRVGIVLAVLALGAALRFAALDFAPALDQARPDEIGNVAQVSLYGRFPGLVLLYGGGYNLPLAALLQIWSQWTAGMPLGELLRRDWHAAVLPVRAWSALLSTATIALAFAAGRHLGGAATGIVAALLLAVAPLAVREAHFAKPDSAAAFSAAVLVFAMARPWSSVARRSVALGAAGAFVTSTKLCAGFLPAVVFALAWPGGMPARVIDRRSLLIGAAAFGLTWAALNPFLVLNPVDIWTSAKMIHGWFSTADWLPGSDLVPGPLRYHAWISLRHGCGALFALLVLPALVHALVRGGDARCIAIAVLGYAATTVLSPMVLARFFLPAVPGLCVLVASFVVDGIRRLVPSPRTRAIALAVAALAMTAEPLVNAARLVDLLGREDTRELAVRWMSAHVPPNARVATCGAPTLFTDFGAPPVGERPKVMLLPRGRWPQGELDYVIRHEYPLPYSSAPLPPDHPPLEPVAVFDPFDGPTNDPVLEPLDAFYLPLAHFDGVARPGPRIEIYAVRRRER